VSGGLVSKGCKNYTRVHTELITLQLLERILSKKNWGNVKNRGIPAVCDVFFQHGDDCQGLNKPTLEGDIRAGISGEN